MAALDKRATGRAEVYQDTYYDDPAGTLTAGDRELRVRTVYGPDDTRSMLTYKGAGSWTRAFNSASITGRPPCQIVCSASPSRASNIRRNPR
jgi:hypothetical protein